MFVITGGLGGLGLRAATLLQDLYGDAHRVLLASRSGLAQQSLAMLPQAELIA